MYGKRKELEEEMFSQSEDEEAEESVLIMVTSSEGEEEEQVKSESNLGAKRDDLSQPVCPGLQVTGLHCPPVPTPLLYSSQPPVSIQTTFSQPPNNQRPHSSFLPHSDPQQGPEALEMMQGNSALLPIDYSTRGQGQAFNFPQLPPEPKKKPWTRYSTDQLEQLEALFQEEPFPDREKMKAIADAVGVAPENIKVWFQNYRSRVWKEDAVTANVGDGHSTAGYTTHHQTGPTLPTLPHSSLGAPPVSHSYVGNSPQLTPVPPLSSTLSTQMAPSHSSLLSSLSSPGQSREWDTGQHQLSSQWGLAMFPTRPMYNPPPLWQSSLPLFQAGMPDQPDPKLSDSVYLGLRVTGLRCPPVSTPLLYSLQPPFSIQTTFSQPPNNQRPHSVPQQGPEALENHRMRVWKRNPVTAKVGEGQSRVGYTPHHQIGPTLPTLPHSSLGAPPVSHSYVGNSPQLTPVPPLSSTLFTQMAPSHSSLLSSLSSPGQSREWDTGQHQLSSQWGLAMFPTRPMYNPPPLWQSSLPLFQAGMPDLETNNNPMKRKVSEIEERVYSQSEDEESAEETEMSNFIITLSDTTSQPPVSIQHTLPQPCNNQQPHSSFLPHSVPQQGPEALENHRMRAWKRNPVTAKVGEGQSRVGYTPHHQIGPTLPTLPHSSLGAPPVSHSYVGNSPQLTPVPPLSSTLSTQMAPSHSSLLSSLSSPGQSRERGQQHLSSQGGFGGVSHPSHAQPTPTSCQSSSFHQNQ
ncbi:uncharacterized protein LOC115791059 isoform X2 [Archocentrus centrarchus]|uniref:uncharacterized protein LOC115791059 isoform X2 n=1 Tax=Archocentrus centrarchus TaxID=63155 RepID=UPI0011E9B37A|nr:uncharacterized protein LOC115791059 isoform X2 [Archocentrus centrarchus]